uniref:NADH-ubiquinone oxidoreductase chain 2 n=1 Tax=Ixodes vespertilionis TaxID=59656 RepID=A0A8E5JV41_9ACAR|nr:NADH dehydrogenase subunit 2 [Ixodes vespertilionis]QVD40490.1 NADH dehydrogenase subunit 2 [Ixodes vespertilionis]
MMLKKMIFLWVLVLSIFISLSSTFWFSLWMSLEINMLIFIPIMNSKNFLSSNSMLNYYVIQSMSSSVFLFSSIMSSMFSTQVFNLMMMITMLIKLGAAPFHSWFPQIAEGLNFFPFFILTSLQKIIPLHIISMANNYMLIPFIIMSSMVGSLGGLNQTSFKKILAFSSISHLSWIMSLILINQNFWVTYFIIYTLILMKIISLLKKNNSLFIMNSNSMKMTMFSKILLFSFFLSLGGLPPFLGFLTKWVAIIYISKNLSIIIIILIISSLINLFFYMRSLFPMILNLNMMMKSSFLPSPTQSFNFFLINSLGIILFIPFMLSF